MSSRSQDWWRALSQATIAIPLLVCAFTAVADTALPPARDLLADARDTAQSGMPLIVLVSLARCPHCEVVRRSHLLPLLRDTATGARPAIRQVELNGRELLRNFDGKEITHAEFARRHKVKIAPVVFFLDGKGALLTEPLMGSMIPDFYGAYFEAAFDEAKSRLRAARTGD